MLLAEHLSTGVAHAFIHSTTWDTTSDPVEFVNTVNNALYTIFLGIDKIANATEEKYREEIAAGKTLANMQLCDICFLDSFFCEYEKTLDKLPLGEFPSKINQYLEKISIVGEKALARHKLEVNPATIYSLAFVNRIVKEVISKICEQTRNTEKIKEI